MISEKNLEREIINGYTNPYYLTNSFIRQKVIGRGNAFFDTSNAFVQPPSITQFLNIDNDLARTMPAWSEPPIPEAFGPKVPNTGPDRSMPREEQFLSPFFYSGGHPTYPESSFEISFEFGGIIFLGIALFIGYLFLKNQ
jgi:hypothetical protein